MGLTGPPITSRSIMMRTTSSRQHTLYFQQTIMPSVLTMLLLRRQMEAIMPGRATWPSYARLALGIIRTSFVKDTDQQPKCIWIDKNGDMPFTGLQVYFPEFLSQDGKLPEGKDTNYFCNGGRPRPNLGYLLGSCEGQARGHLARNCWKIWTLSQAPVQSHTPASC
jgi:hypothetical protein